ncbi:unnamed protein product [Pedinophyceae sp. YPF-701]|nr:unnamed protein product [Pedinophyceae sp. YPF-701]
MAQKLDLTPYVSQEVADVLLWKDVKKSGVCLGAGVGTYVLYKLVEKQFASYFAKLLCIVVVGCYMYAKAVPVLHKHQIQLKFLEPSDEADAKRVAEKLVVKINKAKAYALHVYSGGSTKDTALLGTGLYLTSRVLASVSLTTLLLAAFVLAMTVPKAYEMNKKEADALLSKVTKQASSLRGQVMSKIPSARKMNAGGSSKPKKSSEPPKTEDKKAQ